MTVDLSLTMQCYYENKKKEKEEGEDRCTMSLLNTAGGQHTRSKMNKFRKNINKWKKTPEETVERDERESWPAGPGGRKD